MTSHRPRLPSFVVAAALGAAVALLLARPDPAVGQQTPGLVRGAGQAGVEKEPTYRFTTVEGNPASADHDRFVIKVPASYGQLHSVTMAGARPVLWYRADDGSLRNVILADGTLVHVVQEHGRGR